VNGVKGADVAAAVSDAACGAFDGTPGAPPFAHARAEVAGAT
jgi:hypothetical protein